MNILVVLEETIQYSVKVEANSPEEAWQKAKDLVMDNPNCDEIVRKQIGDLKVLGMGKYESNSQEIKEII